MLRFSLPPVRMLLYMTNFNLPNFITSVRIIVGLAVPIMMVYGGFGVRVAAGVMGATAASTDWLDGWLARKYNEVTKLGKILDPIADKVYVLLSLSIFAYLSMYSFWWILPIVIRELVITAYRFMFLERGKVVAAVKSGKLKTVLQMGTIGYVYLVFMCQIYFPKYYHISFTYIMYALLALTLWLTVYSGYIFFRNNWKLVTQ